MPAMDSKDNGGISSSLFRIFVTEFVDQKSTEYHNEPYYNMRWAQMCDLTTGCHFPAHIFFKLKNVTISSHN